LKGGSEKYFCVFKKTICTERNREVISSNFALTDAVLVQMGYVFYFACVQTFVIYNIWKYNNMHKH